MSARVSVKTRFTASWQRSVLRSSFVSRHSGGNPRCASDHVATSFWDCSTFTCSAMERGLSVLMLRIPAIVISLVMEGEHASAGGAVREAGKIHAWAPRRDDGAFLK